jgi:thioredoxin-related protein
MSLIIQAQLDTTYRGIKFEDNLNWEQIKMKAMTEKKYIFVDCFATWCQPCKMMDKNVYPDFRLGAEVNAKFISVKVQMDSTVKDNDHIKSWYSVANSMIKDYRIEGYPTYLFFAPDGQIVHKDLGYKNTDNFARLMRLALNPQRSTYLSQFQNYESGERDYRTLAGLTLFTRDLIGNKEMAETMAKDYKTNYLDKIQNIEFLSVSDFEFLKNYHYLINSKDKFFKMAYEKPELFDSLMSFRGAAERTVNSTIQREELSAKILKKVRAKQKLPQWKKLESKITKKYSRIDARLLVLNYKIYFYRRIKLDWKVWAKYKDEKIKLYPLKKPYGFSVYTEINGYGGAWDVFLNCTDTAILNKAIEWADLAISLEGRIAAYLDTKANLLYKLGRIQDAIGLEKEVVELSPKEKSFREAYQKMLRGEPTWVIAK